MKSTESKTIMGEQTTMTVDATPTGLIIQVLISHKGRDLIKYTDIILKGFDDRGQEVPIAQAIKTAQFYGEIRSNSFGGAAGGVYRVSLAKSQQLTSIEFQRGDQKATFSFAASPAK